MEENIEKNKPRTDRSTSAAESRTERCHCERALTSSANAITKVPVSSLIITLWASEEASLLCCRLWHGARQFTHFAAKTLINKMRMERGDHISLLKRHGLGMHAFEVVCCCCVKPKLSSRLWILEWKVVSWAEGCTEGLLGRRGQGGWRWGRAVEAGDSSHNGWEWHVHRLINFSHFIYIFVFPAPLVRHGMTYK